LKLKFNAQNVIDELLQADGTDCKLIKKAAIDFIVDNGQDILASPSYERLDESPELTKEVMMEFAKSRDTRKRGHNED
jgi:hypothetical protein